MSLNIDLIIGYQAISGPEKIKKLARDIYREREREIDRKSRLSLNIDLIIGYQAISGPEKIKKKDSQ